MSLDSTSGQLIFASSCVVFSLYFSSRRHEKLLRQQQQKLAATTPPIHVHSRCNEGDITLHHIQNLSEYYPSENYENSEKYFHLLKSDEYVMGKKT
jgi:hypothetical protein